MKLSINCLSPVSDSSLPKYMRLHKHSTITRSQQSTPLAHRVAAKLHRLTHIRGRDTNVVHQVPQGHVPIYVGQEMRRFVISAHLLNVPVIMDLLDKSAQEFGYNQQGVLCIACDVPKFEKILEAIGVILKKTVNSAGEEEEIYLLEEPR